MTSRPRFSSRAPWGAESNALARARARLVSERAEILDLTQSNPTRAGIDYPLEELAEILAESARASYEPHPLGIRAAREAVAGELSSGRSTVDPDDVVLTASTSEAYSFLFKLFCNPGDAVLTHTPTYPLLDHLAMLEGVALEHFPLEYDAGSRHRWVLDADRLEGATTDRTRLVVVIHPNNPTGSFIGAREQDSLAAELPDTIALVSDEVFSMYEISPSEDRAPSAGFRRDRLAFALGGLSKSAGLPHWKLGWIHLGGPAAARREVLRGLELAADSFLSVSTPVQVALPRVLAIAPRIRAPIVDRLRANLATLQREIASRPDLEILPVEGGWSAVIRIPRLVDDESLAVDLLESKGVLVHPGYFFDFPSEGFFVVSLLTDPEVFAEGVRRMVLHLPPTS